MMTSNRSSFPAMISLIRLRVPKTNASTGVARMGKKRIRCSGGGSTVMSLIRSSSVLLVRSVFAVIAKAPKSQSKKHKKTAGVAGGLGSISTFCYLRSDLSTAVSA